MCLSWFPRAGNHGNFWSHVQEVSSVRSRCLQGLVESFRPALFPGLAVAVPPWPFSASRSVAPALASVVT